MSGETRPIVVVGAGISGLAVARELVRRGRRVIVLEAAARAGGVLFSERKDGYLCEHAANGFLDSGEGGAGALASEIGVDLVTAAPAAKRRWVWRKGKLRPVPTGPPGLLSTDLLSVRGKLRLFLEPFIGRPAQTEESVASFARRRLGVEAAEAVMAPFVTGIYAGDADRLSIQAALPRLAALEAEHGGLLKGMIASRKKGKRVIPVQRTPRAGMGAIPQAIARSLGDSVRLGARVTKIELGAGDRSARVTVDGETIDAARLVLATPPYATADLVAAHDAALADTLRAIEVAPVAVAYVGFRRDEVSYPLDGFGYLVAKGEALRVLGCLFESTVWPDRAPSGHVLLRLIYGGVRDPSAVHLDDAALGRAVAADLARSLGITATPRFFHARRHERAIPQYNLGHRSRVDEAEARAAKLGLILAGNAYHGVAVNDCVTDARRVADRVADGR
jgi:oxygen-dependent protoporphyrinogen oxidase